MSERLTILMDLDQICADLNGAWIQLYNSLANDNLTPANITSYNLHKITKPEYADEVYKLLHTPGLFRNLKPIPGAIDALKYLKLDRKHEIIIASSSVSPLCTKEKGEWLQEHLPFIDIQKDTFFGHRKYMLCGDVIIDDAPNQIGAYRKAWPESIILTIAYPFNKDVSHLCNLYAESFQDTEKAWDEIITYLDAYARRKY